MTGHAVVIAGGGPIGMMLAAKLRLAGAPGALTSWFGPTTAAGGPTVPARG